MTPELLKTIIDDMTELGFSTDSIRSIKKLGSVILVRVEGYNEVGCVYDVWGNWLDWI